MKIMRLATVIVDLLLIARISDSRIRYKTGNNGFLSAKPSEFRSSIQTERWNNRNVHKFSNSDVVRKQNKGHHYYNGKSVSVDRQRQWRQTQHSHPRTYLVDNSILAHENLDQLCGDLVIDPRRLGGLSNINIRYLQL